MQTSQLRDRFHAAIRKQRCQLSSDHMSEVRNESDIPNTTMPLNAEKARPFSKARCTVLTMARQKRENKTVLKSIARSKRRSSVFWWMVDTHDGILESANGEMMDWPTVCQDILDLGLTDTKGNPVTEGNARQTWWQARKYVDKKRAAEAAKPPRPVRPSDVSKNWRPPAAPPPAPAANPRRAPTQQKQLSSIRKEESEDDAPYDPDEQIAHLIRTVRQRG